MKHWFTVITLCATLACSLLIASQAHAQQAPGRGPLTLLTTTAPFANHFGSVERAMAETLDAAYNDLLPLCLETCNPRVNNLFQSVLGLYGLVGSLGQIPPGSPQQIDSLRTIARALRNFAPEELSALRALSNEFATDQRDQIRGRLQALRSGAQGFAVNGRPGDGTSEHLALQRRALIGGASADLPSDFSRWGGFLNGSYSDADRDPTDLEDAFEITGDDVSVGVDYRLSYRSVLGAMLTYTDKDLQFDSSRSTTAGDIQSSGLAGVLYASYEWDGPYLTASVGYQTLSNDITRRSPVIVAASSTDSHATTVALDGGWTMQRGAFNYEPVLRILYRDTDFDAFTEREIGTSSGAALTVAARSISTFNASVGMKLNYAFKPSFGVLLPYFQGEWRHEFKDEALRYQANFANIVASGVTSITSTLRLTSDRPDTSYYVAEAGASAVFKHGIQGFLSARSLFGLENSKFFVISLGVRGEF